MERTEMRMIRWMGGDSLKGRQPSTELRRCLGVDAVGDVMIRGRLRWQGRVEGKDDGDYVMDMLGWWWRRRCQLAGRGRPGRSIPCRHTSAER